jgi:hypothetical protein
VQQRKEGVLDLQVLLVAVSAPGAGAGAGSALEQAAAACLAAGPAAAPAELQAFLRQLLPEGHQWQTAAAHAAACSAAAAAALAAAEADVEALKSQLASAPPGTASEELSRDEELRRAQQALREAAAAAASAAALPAALLRPAFSLERLALPLPLPAAAAAASSGRAASAAAAAAAALRPSALPELSGLWTASFGPHGSEALSISVLSSEQAAALTRAAVSVQAEREQEEEEKAQRGQALPPGPPLLSTQALAAAAWGPAELSGQQAGQLAELLAPLAEVFLDASEGWRLLLARKLIGDRNVPSGQVSFLCILPPELTDRAEAEAAAAAAAGMQLPQQLLQDRGACSACRQAPTAMLHSFGQVNSEPMQWKPQWCRGALAVKSSCALELRWLGTAMMLHKCSL